MVEFTVEQKGVRVSSTGISEEGVTVVVSAEGPPQDLDRIKGAIREHFRNARLKALSAAAPPAPLAKEEAPAPAAEPEEAAPAEVEAAAETPAEGMPPPEGKVSGVVTKPEALAAAEAATVEEKMEGATT
ncbi:MAG: hypothetical protein V3V35_05015 [Dehalococcoidia bacterium]